MHANNTITVSTIRNLEVGDQFAMGFLNGIISGTVTALVHVINDLTDEQREYMKSQNMEIPEGQWTAVGGQSSVLIFGDFVETSGLLSNNHSFKHMYVDYNTAIAHFPKS